MTYIRNILKNIFKQSEDKVLLGRWNIDYCNKKMGSKIDLANEDHCFCSEYMTDKLSKELAKTDNNKNK